MVGVGSAGLGWSTCWLSLQAAKPNTAANDRKGSHGMPGMMASSTITPAALASTAVAYMSYELVEVPGARLVRQATAKQPATMRKVEEPA